MGCFRSGTSAVAGTLHHLGVFMGDVFDKPTKNNKKGFWEDLEFKSFHNFYSNCESPDEDLICKMDLGYKNLICIRDTDHEIWGVKDPQISKHLKKITSLVSDHKVIVCRRSVEEISASMTRAIGFSDEKMYLPLAKLYVDELNAALSEYTGPVLEVHKTDSMLKILDPICEFVGLPSNQSAIDFLS